MSAILEAISEKGTATAQQIQESTGLSKNKLWEGLRVELDAGHITEDPQFTYHVAGNEPPRGEWARFSRQIRTRDLLNGLCPMRGGNAVQVDERCPEAVPCEMAIGENANRDLIAIPVPVLLQQSRCRTCVDTGVREKELEKAPRKRRVA